MAQPHESKARGDATPAAEGPGRRRAARSRLGAESLGARRRALGRVWLINLALAVVIGLSYLERLVDGAPARIVLFGLLGLVSSLATLTLVPLACLWLCARARSLAWIQAVTWMLFQLGLYIDTRIHRLFGYHFNGSALNLFVTSGSEDSYRLGPVIWITGFVLAAVLVLLELGAWRLALPRAALALPGGSTFRRGAIAVGALLLCVVSVEKTLYARAEVTLDRQLTAVSQELPLYPRFSVVPFLPESVREQLPAVPAVRLGQDARALDWPRSWPTVAPGGPRPDVVVLVIDSWRADALDPEITPHMARLERSSRRFGDHLSTGNGTRFGVFGLLYGLHGSYWWSVLAERRAPVLVDVLQELDYEIRVFSSASQDFPEFRSTAWSSVPEAVVDDFDAERQWVRDERLADRCIEWWSQRPAGPQRRPRFTFVLLDSAHQTYDFPGDQAPFQPCAEELDYIEMSRSHDPALVRAVRNRYLNGVHHADRVAGRLVTALEASGALERTLLVVTGDHGEEFAEHGFWGHTGNFTPTQVAVPFLLRGPGIEPGLELRPTSHLDLAPTLLELLGADPALRAEWCLGESLLDPPHRRARVVAAWSEIGLVAPLGIVRVPRAASAEATTSVWSSDWRPLADQAGALAHLADGLQRLDEECNRFLVPDGR